ncbi:MAG: phosphatidate cytidylyltransferase [Candidatus Zixiibacteriota bacterium]
MAALVIPTGYYVLGLSPRQALAILIPIALAMLLIDISRLRQWAFWRNFASRIGGQMVRGHEQLGDFTGATYILISVCMTIAMYSKPVAIAAIAFIIVGDTFAALVGRKFGRHRFGRKSVEGSVACLVGTALVAVLAPGLTLTVALVGATVATITEAVSLKVDDNISVPIVSGLAMTLLQRILESS